MKKKILSLLIFVFFVTLLIPITVSAQSTIFEKPADGRISSGYGMRDGKMHHGIDIANDNNNSPITATFGGVVSQSYYSSTYGNVVFVEHNINGQTVETVYAHLKERHVKAGDKVSKGTRLGYMGNTGQSRGQHLHFEVHFGKWNNSKSNAVDPQKALNGDFDGRFGDGNTYKVYHATQGELATFNSLAAAKEYSSNWNNTAVIRESDGEQVFVNGLKKDNYGVFHTKHQLLAAFAIKENAINYTKRWQNTVVRATGTLEQVYARPDMGSTKYEVYHTSQGVLAEFHFDYLARAYMNKNANTITIEKSSGKQIAQHPDANKPQYEIHHSVHGKLATFSFFSAAKRYSNNWAHTVVIDNVTKKEMYARDDLGDFKFAVRRTSDDSIIEKFHFKNHAQDFANKYTRGVYVDQL